jgi:antitoxin component YwqK of YwqJK toxin-antitoxin module
VKKLLTIVLCAAAAVLGGCAKQSEVDGDLLQNRNDVYYLPNEGKPFTGIAVKKFENGQKNWERTYKDGKQHGLETWWHENENGQKWTEGPYKDGRAHGLWTAWHANGQKEYEATFKYGKRISRKGWDEDGYPK